MGAADWMKSFKNFIEGGSYDEDEWEYPESEKESPRGRREEPAFEEEPEIEKTFTKASRKKSGGKVVDFDSTRSEARETMSVVIVCPTKIEEAAHVCDYLRENKLCIINMHDVDHHTAQRIADYLGGVSYALNGQVERVDSHIFVMGPEGSKIAANLKEGLRSGELFSRASR